MRRRIATIAGAGGSLAAALLAGAAGSAAAQDAPLATRPPEVRTAGGELDEIRAELARQAGLIADQQREIQALKAERDATLAEIRARGAPSPFAALALAQAAPAPAPRATVVLPSAPVGEAPEPTRAEVAALPPELGVLTAPGTLVIDPSLEYVRTSNNRLVFRGVEIVPGVQLGVIEASDADRDTGVANIAARYGLTNRLEMELRVPYVVRHDRITTLAQRDETISRNIELDGRGLGDIEASLRYQLNGGRNGWPVFVATTRVKSPTGLGPYEVDYDEFGVASELATGSGFWAVEGGLTMLYPSDPVVIFGALTYLHNFSRDIDREVGGALVGRVEPGASIGASLGFGLSLNPRFSVSFGYTHNYIRRTRTELGATVQSSQPLQVGNFLVGSSYRFNERLTVNGTFEFGMTADASDVRIMLRTPYRF
ncbi:transporter [Phenylobacterium sp.]|uniref:transporter n=1 Tax=Phenylobacterium sp. TaxID=1871053 RepID=UPI0035B3EC90